MGVHGGGHGLSKGVQVIVPEGDLGRGQRGGHARVRAEVHQLVVHDGVSGPGDRRVDGNVSVGARVEHERRLGPEEVGNLLLNRLDIVVVAAHHARAPGMQREIGMSCQLGQELPPQFPRESEREKIIGAEVYRVSCLPCALSSGHQRLRRPANIQSLFEISIERGGIFHPGSDQFLAFDPGDHLRDDLAVSCHGGEAVESRVFRQWCSGSALCHPKGKGKEGQEYSESRCPSSFITPFKHHPISYRRKRPRCCRSSPTRVPAREQTGGGMAVAEPSAWEMHATLSTTIMLKVILKSKCREDPPGDRLRGKHLLR